MNTSLQFPTVRKCLKCGGLLRTHTPFHICLDCWIKVKDPNSQWYFEPPLPGIALRIIMPDPMGNGDGPKLAYVKFDSETQGWFWRSHHCDEWKPIAPEMRWFPLPDMPPLPVQFDVHKTPNLSDKPL